MTFEVLTDNVLQLQLCQLQRLALSVRPVDFLLFQSQQSFQLCIALCERQPGLVLLADCAEELFCERPI